MDFLKFARLSDAPMTDLMVDIETTGTDPYHNAMLQLAAVEFNYDTGEIGRVFNRSLHIPKGRYWDEDCRNKFWAPKRALLARIMSTAEDPTLVTQAFFDWVGEADRPLRFWSRGNFDFWFVQSYMDRIDRPMPFQFWAARDMRAFIAGLNNSVEEPDMTWLTMPGEAHDALYDCVIQLKRLFSARDRIFHEILPPEGDCA